MKALLLSTLVFSLSNFVYADEVTIECHSKGNIIRVLGDVIDNELHAKVELNVPGQDSIVEDVKYEIDGSTFFIDEASVPANLKNEFGPLYAPTSFQFAPSSFAMVNLPDKDNEIVTLRIKLECSVVSAPMDIRY